MTEPLSKATGVIGPGSPATATVVPGEHGGLSVRVDVPTYGGGARFTLTVERDEAGGDWRVHLPWPDNGPEVSDVDGVAVLNGIAYLGSPDVDRASTLPPPA